MCSVFFLQCPIGFLSFFSKFLLVSFQRQAKYTENKLKAIKARNEYLLALEATNASVFKYYIHDLSDLIDVSDMFGLLLLHFASENLVLLFLSFNPF